jgi:Trehalase
MLAAKRVFLGRLACSVQKAVAFPSREQYYWDTYWVVKGLLVSQMFATAKVPDSQTLILDTAQCMCHLAYFNCCQNTEGAWVAGCRRQPCIYGLSVWPCVEWESDILYQQEVCILSGLFVNEHDKMRMQCRFASASGEVGGAFAVRSQPPLLSCMVDAVWMATGDLAFLQSAYEVDVHESACYLTFGWVFEGNLSLFLCNSPYCLQQVVKGRVYCLAGSVNRASLLDDWPESREFESPQWCNFALE